MILNRILLDIEINKRCLEEETTPALKKLFELWIEYDKELIELVYELYDKFYEEESI